MNLKRKLLPLAMLGACSIGVEAQVNYGEALQKSIYFYEAQQSGVIPDWNRVEWRGDSTLDDGSDVGVDLSGGWYDAGDHVKFGFPMAASATFLAWGVVEYPEAYEQTGQMQHIKNNLRFVADYIVAAHPEPNVFYGQVGTGSDDHSWWGPAEVVHLTPRAASDRPSYAITADCPGTDLAGEAAAALSAISMIFADDDPAYSNTLVRHAKELYDFAYTYRGKYSDCITDATAFYNSWSGYNDELVWSAAWLYRATGEQAYLDNAIEDYANLNTEQQSTVKSYKWTQAWDDKGYGSYVIMSQLTNDPEYRADAERWLDYWTTGYEGDRVPYTPGGLAQLDTWGANRYAANTSFVALLYSDYLKQVDPSNSRVSTYYDFAVGQMSYIMGDNPQGHSYQIGMDPNGPKNPHHRTAHASWADSLSVPEQSRHLLVGALVGGPGSGDAYEDDRTNYIDNEVATDYNALFTSALARLWLDFGGDPIPESQFPEPEVRGLEYYVEAKDNSSGPRHLGLATRVHNHTAWPARNGENLKYRYFVDLNAEFDLGYSLSDFEVTASYNQASSVSQLLPWGDPTDNLYYVEVDFTGVDVFPGGQSESRKEVQFRIAISGAGDSEDWDNSADPSYDNYDSAYKNATKIALYEGDTLVWGEEPTPPCGVDTGINCIPTADSSSVSTDFETAVAVSLSGADSDGSISARSVTSGPANGTLSGSGESRTYTPDAGFFGSDSFSFVVEDNDGAVSSPATVNITVEEPIIPAVAIVSPLNGSDIVQGTNFTLSYSLSNAASAQVSVDGNVVVASNVGSSVQLAAPDALGGFVVDIVALDSDGNELAASDSATYNSIVEPPNGVPQACFDTSTTVYVGSPISFDAACSSDPDGDALSFAWNFDDGGTASGETAVHSFVLAGSYSVSLSVSDGEDSDTIAQTVVVEERPAASVSCAVGSADIWPTGFVLNNIAVTNDGTETLDAWTVELPLGQVVSISGSWNADLEVVGNSVFASGNQNTTPLNPGQTVVFGFQGAHDGSISMPECLGGGDEQEPNTDPLASFSTAVSNLNVSFDASASSDPDGDTLTYTWDFGDGQTATGQSPNYSYAAGGDYSVSLTVSDGRGGSDIATDMVTVVQAPNGDPTASFSSSTSGLSASFDASASSDPDADVLTYTWDFGDGSVGTGVSASHAYASEGTYDVSLTVDDGNGGTDTTMSSVTVAPVVGGGNCEYIVENSWSSGFVATIRITNNGSTTINGWSVSWEYTDGSSRTSGWNSTVTGNNPYTATPLSWNANIAPGQSVEFGLQGALGSVGATPPVPVVTGSVCE